MKLKRIVCVLAATVLMSSMALTGCGNTIDTNKTLMTVGGEDVDLGFSYFVARYDQANYDMLYRTYFGDTVWSQDMTGNGQTMEDEVKDSILEDIQHMYLLENHMEEYGVEVTAEEQAEITKAAEQFLADNTDEAIEQVGATQEILEKYLYLYLVQTRMQTAIKAEADVTVTDAEANRSRVRYIALDTRTYTDEEGAAQVYSDEETEELLAEAEAFYQEAQEDWDAAVEKYGYEVQEDTFGANDTGSIPASVVDDIEGLQDGEMSELIEDVGICYVFVMDATTDEEATETARETLEAEKIQEYYNDTLTAWQEEANIVVDEDAWAEVKFDSLFTVVYSETEDSDVSADSE